MVNSMDEKEEEYDLDDLPDEMREDIWDILFPFLTEKKDDEKEVEPWNVEFLTQSKPRSSYRFLSM